MKGSLIEMSDRREELILTVMDDHASLLPIVHYLTKWRRCDEMLVWLIENNLTGQDLIDWIQAYWKNSALHMSKFILMKLKRERIHMPDFLA